LCHHPDDYEVKGLNLRIGTLKDLVGSRWLNDADNGNKSFCYLIVKSFTMDNGPILAFNVSK